MDRLSHVHVFYRLCAGLAQIMQYSLMGRRRLLVTPIPILQESRSMMKKTGFILCMTASMALLGARPAAAQVKFSFHQPLDFDPNSVLIFTNINPLFSNGAVLVPPTPAGTVAP